MNSKLPTVAIIGPPNAGKSSLLNKIAGMRLAVTSDVEGTTRDRQYATTSWNGVEFLLVDTAGIVIKPGSELEINMQEQVDIAIQEADVLLLVLDGKLPVRSFEPKLMDKIRKSKKPLILAINKSDKPRELQSRAIEFAGIGVQKSVAVSATTGGGVGDLLDLVVADLPKTPAQEEKNLGINVAIIGKPNVGKSSLFNTIMKEDRVVVSSVPGTTRTAIDSAIEIKGQQYTFVDTAGLKRKSDNQAQPDIFSGFQTLRSISRADVCILIVDANDLTSKQDQRLAGQIIQMERGVILVVNKIDTYEGNKKTLQDNMGGAFPMLWMSPVHLISAKDNIGVTEMLDNIKPIYDARGKTVDQDTLDEFLKAKLKKSPPRLMRDQRAPKVYKLTQLGSHPPQFSLEVNHPAAISKQFRNTVENGIIKELGFWGTPIKLHLSRKK